MSRTFEVFGAKAPLGPLDVKVKVKAKKLRNSMILPKLLDDRYASLQACEYARMRLCKYAIIHVSMYSGIEACKYAIMPLYNYTSMQICNNK